MTDLDVLELIHNKSPDELSVEEIEQLRQSIASSPELRREIAERVEMEQYLHHALARVNLSIDTIILRADARSAGPTSTLAQAGLAVCALLGCLIGLAIVVAIVSPRTPDEPKLAAASPGETPTEEAAADRKAAEAKLAAELSAPSPSDRTANEANAESTAATPVESATQLAQAPPAAPAAAVEPWEVDLQAADELPASSQGLFAAVPVDAPLPQPDDLKKWFANVDGQRGEFAVRDMNGGRWGYLEGLFRLRAPLKPKTALQLALWDYNLVRIHCWAGRTGATIDYFEHHNKPWVGYVTARKESEPIPTSFVLAANDEYRYWRTNPHQPASLQLRHQMGLLTLSHGDVRLLDIPMAVAPTEIYFEGNLLVRHVAMIPAAELPPLAEPRPLIAELVPAKQDWSPLAEGVGTFTRHDDGSVELKAEKNAQPVFTSFQISRSGPQELIFEVDAPQAGTAVCLVDAEGKPIHLASFMREANGLIQVGLPIPGNMPIDAVGDLANRPMGYLGAKTWLKLVLASGWLKLSTSVDGQHWAKAIDPRADASQGFTGVGLYVTNHESARSIRLRQVTLRDFDAINGLSPPELRASASELATEVDFKTFQEVAIKAKPANVKSADWLRACAIRRLAFGASKPLGDDLLKLLWKDSLRMKLSHEARLRLLDDIMTLAPTWDDAAQAERQVRYFEEFGNILADLDRPRAFSRISRPQMVTPIWTNTVFDFFPAGLARREVLELATDNQWGELDAFGRRFSFHFFAEKSKAPELYQWAAAIAQQAQAQRPGKNPIAWQREWQHPLVTELSKEGFNVLADLRVALDSAAYSDACQVIGAATASGMLGLLPDTQDPDLSVSLPATVALAMREHPRFKDTMAEEFGPLGRLRVRQAIASGDAAVVEAATLQFYGTEAAAEAHLWLGDRSLSSGAFAAAQAHYRAARRTAPKALIGRLAASEQLAAAMMGRDAGQPILGTVDFGETKVAAADLTNLTNELRSARAADSAISQAASAAIKDLRLPAPRNYDVAARSRLDGEVGNNPQSVPGEYTSAGVDWPALSLDWVARQASVLQLDNRVLVSNRFQLASYDPNSGAVQWRQGLGGDQSQTHDWPLAPARPLATSALAFVRRFRGNGPGLSAIDLTNGQVKWDTKLDGERWVISDPALAEGTLYACIAQRTEVGYTLSLGAFDPQTGVLLKSSPLVDLRENWWRTRDCQLLAVDASFVISTAGAVLRCDLMGNMRWARRQLWIPPAVDRFWMLQAQQPPLLDGGRLFVVQPGVPAVVALDPDNGRQLWKANLPNARRVLGVVGKQVFIDTTSGVRAVDAATGKRVWQFDAPDLLDGYVLSPQDGLLVSIREPVENENNRLVSLVWLDVATGKPRHQVQFPQLKHEQPFLGPMFVRADRIWAFSGKGAQDPFRDLVEFVPK